MQGKEVEEPLGWKTVLAHRVWAVRKVKILCLLGMHYS
jgi:hypothetical protein